MIIIKIIVRTLLLALCQLMGYTQEGYRHGRAISVARLFMRYKGSSTVDEFASGLDLPSVSVRQPLGALRRDGLVSTQEIRRSTPCAQPFQPLTSKCRMCFPDTSRAVPRDIISFQEAEHSSYKTPPSPFQMEGIM